jgi:CheY-like chemotaxis protein
MGRAVTANRQVYEPAKHKQECYISDNTQVVYLNPISIEADRQDRQAALVVEDDRTALNWISEYLSVIGVRDILCAPDAKNALRLLSAHPDRIGLVVVDLYRPGMNGFTLCSSLQEQEGRDWLPVIGITAGSMSTAAHAAKTSGMHFLLSKPCTLAVFKAVVEQCLPHIRHCG